MFLLALARSLLCPAHTMLLLDWAACIWRLKLLDWHDLHVWQLLCPLPPMTPPVESPLQPPNPPSYPASNP